MKSKSFDIYNFYCAGEVFQTEGNTSYLGLIEITLPGIGEAKIEIERKYLNTPKEKDCRKTGLLTILLNDEVSEDHTSIANDLCSLLSFALNGHVEYRECIAESSWFKSSGMISHGGWREIIISRFGENIRHFIESCWELYRQEKDRRRLFETIRLLTQINETKDFIEQKIALTSVMLENLKHTYASGNENYKRDGHQFYYKPKRKGDDSLSFRQLLTDMIEEVNMPEDFKFDLSKTIKNRNKIIHQGLLGCSFDVMWEQYEDMISFIRVYLLSLLNFKGHYYSFDQPNVVKSMDVEPFYLKDR
tara:strand:- start:231 stop:1142 length:912 start_codon:yes stop_codon:yes gene_type:complete